MAEKLAIDKLMRDCGYELIQRVASECARIAEQYSDGEDAARKIEAEFRLTGEAREARKG